LRFGSSWRLLIACCVAVGLLALPGVAFGQGGTATVIVHRANEAGVGGVTVGWDVDCPYPANYQTGQSHPWWLHIVVTDAADAVVVADSVAYGGGTTADSNGADANPNDSAHPLGLVVMMDPKHGSPQAFQVTVTLECDGSIYTVDQKEFKLRRSLAGGSGKGSGGSGGSSGSDGSGSGSSGSGSGSDGSGSGVSGKGSGGSGSGGSGKGSGGSGAGSGGSGTGSGGSGTGSGGSGSSGSGLHCIVPMLAGSTLTAARKLLTHAHCTLGVVTRPNESSGRTLLVRSSSPPAGTRLRNRAKVDIKLGKP